MSDTDATELEHAATSLGDELDPDEIVITVDVGGVPLEILRKAKSPMSSAQGAMASQPTAFHKCDFAITAATDIMKRDKLQFSFPFSEETVDAFDRDSVVVGRSEPCPAGKQPGDDELAKAKSVRRIVKEEKGAQARKIGIAKSGVQSHCTHKQRWKQWRDVCAVCRFMNPSMEIQTVCDSIKGRIEHCGSVGEINDKATEDAQKHVNKLKRQKAKADKEAKIQKDPEDAEAARQQAATAIEESEEEENEILEETQETKEATFEGPRSESAAARAATPESKKVQSNATKEKQAQAKKLAAEQAKKMRGPQKQLDEQRKAVAIDDEPKSKKLKRSDPSLPEGVLAPRKKAASDGDGWKPPAKKDSAKLAFDPPGDQWLQKTRKCKKMRKCEEAGKRKNTEMRKRANVNTRKCQNAQVRKHANSKKSSK